MLKTVVPIDIPSVMDEPEFGTKSGTDGGFTPFGESEQDKTPHSRGGLTSP